MRMLRVGLLLLVSAGAFTGLWMVSMTGVEAPPIAEASIAPEPIGAIATAPNELELVLPEEPPEEAPAPSGIEVPDLSGMTALRAFRRGRELGFVVDVRDEDGRRVPASERLSMRVMEDTQEPAPGSFAEEGATIHLTARYPGLRYAAGY